MTPFFAVTMGRIVIKLNPDLLTQASPDQPRGILIGRASLTTHLVTSEDLGRINRRRTRERNGWFSGGTKQATWVARPQLPSNGPRPLVRCRSSRYYRYGLEEEDFVAAFEAVRGTAEGYDALARALGAAERIAPWK